MSNPRVSIACSVLNQRDILKGMIHSIRAQSLADWELVLVDDGSTEDIAGLVNEFNDPRIKLHIFPENRGVPHGINYALEHCIGDYVQPLSADERLEPNKLLWQVGYLDEHADIDCIWGLPQNGDLGERPEWEQYVLRAHNRSNEAWVRTLLNLEAIPIGGASSLMRRKVLESIGLFDPQFYTTSDLEWYVRFFKKHKGVVMPYRWAWDLARPDSLSKKVTAEQFGADMKRVRAKHPLKPPKVMSEVTVAIPVRNMASTIAATLNSVLSQTWSEHIRIMVLDDASTDNTVDIVKSFGRPHKIELLQFEENMGCIEAQNQMLARCETPFFMVLAADDTIDPMLIEKCIAAFSADPWLEFVATQTDFIGADGEPHKGEHPMKSIPKAREWSRDQWRSIFRVGNVYFGAGLYRTQALKDVGGWDAQYGVISDYEMYLKLLQRENFRVIEEDLTHTRIHDGQRSLLKTRAEQKALKKHYAAIKRRFYPPRPKLIIATPFYEMRGFAPYITSLAETIKILVSCGIEHEYWELSGDSYVERAKNTIMNKFAEDEEATHLLMIDSDMQWDPAAVLKMMALPEEIVMGSYPQKNGWSKWTALPVLEDQGNGRSHPVGRVLDDGSALLKSAYLAGGFIIFKREALVRFIEAYPELRYMDPSADPNDPERVYTEFCACATKKLNETDAMPIRWGEDRIMGQRFAKIGIDSWIYPNINFGHYGIRGWVGNYDRFMRNPELQKPNPDHANTVLLS